MRRIFTLFFTIATLTCFTQVPQGISYQAVAFNTGGTPVTNSAVGIKISILDNSTTGTVVYSETHIKTTNTHGLFNLNIGQGTPITGIFSNINWSTNSKFLKVEIDPTGGTSYTNVGSNELMSSPYSLIAEDVINDKDEQTISLSGNTISISNGNSVSLPVNHDNSSSNEIQTLSLSGNSLSISSGNTVVFPTNNDNSITNEIQSLSINNDTIFLSQSNYVVLPEIILESPNGTQYTLSVNDSGFFSTNLFCNPGVEQANAGTDNNGIQGTIHQLSANTPVPGTTGQWSIVSGTGGTFSNTNNFNSTFSGVSGQTYILRWTLTNTCGSSYDDVSITFSNFQLPSCSCQGQTLFAFPSSNSTAIVWGSTGLIGPSAQSPNDGESNTNAIIGALGSSVNWAAQQCYNMVAYGYSDWYLPSKDELNCLYLNGLAGGGHKWSSSEFNSSSAWVQNLNNGTQGTAGKTNNNYYGSICVRK